ncbi:MAG: nitroreductase family deazaflavin-dependent oxidoreductase [Chloroflexota bacterium]
MEKSWAEFDAFNRAAVPEYLDLLAEDLEKLPPEASLLIDGGIVNTAVAAQAFPANQMVCLSRPGCTSADIWQETPARLEMKAMFAHLPEPEKMWQKFLEFDTKINQTILQESQSVQLPICTRAEADSVALLAQRVAQTLPTQFIKAIQPKASKLMSDPNDRNQQVIEEFRANAGQVGGFFADKQLLLLHTTGAKSGQPRISPLVTMQDGDRFIIIASKGGSPTHPDWYHNLVAHPDAHIEVGTEQVPVLATEAQEPERSQLYAKMAAQYSFFADYAKKVTTRVIPVFILTRR